MYTEEYEKKGFPLLGVVFKILIIIIFIFLLIWLLPKVVAPNIKKNNNSGSNNNEECSEKVKCDTRGIGALTSQIFSNNLEKMKDAAISYYTIERLPKEVGDSETMTLSDMIGKKLIVALIDKNNKACDVEKSYVKISKLDDEYILKVNIKDSEKEDYILVHLGCYSYCNSDVCEKKTEEDNAPVKGSKVNPVVSIKQTPTNITPSVNPTVKVTYKCQNIDGKYYNKTGKKVSESEYIRSCESPKCKVVSGYYFGKDGNVVTKYTYNSECGSQETLKCTAKNGKYYDKNGKAVSEVNYIKSCEAPKCKIVSGYYFGKDGKNVSKSTYESECKAKEYLYEYTKTTNATFSAWTSWSSWKKTNCSTSEINCSDNDVTCLSKLQVLKRKEQIGTYEKTYAKTRQVVRQTGSYTQKSCSKYNYVEINKTIYATTTTYTTINNVVSSTKQTTGNWKYNGRASYSNPPRDTNTTHYVFAGADYSYCGDTCTTLPNYYYDSYTYSGGLTNVSSTTVPGSTSTSSSTSTSYEANCGSYVTKTIPVYGTITVTEKAKRTEPLYGDVCYQSTKTRTLIDKGSKKTKWSSYNDESLLNDGWTYTGNKKSK